MPDPDGLIGQWRLVDYFVHQPDGQKEKWPGEQEGNLEYTLGGQVFMSIKRTADTLVDLSETDILKTDLWYEGYFEVAGETVIHHVKHASLPEREGQSLVRQFKLENDQLTLTGQGLKDVVSLVWRRNS